MEHLIDVHFEVVFVDFVGGGLVVRVRVQEVGGRGGGWGRGGEHAELLLGGWDWVEGVGVDYFGIGLIICYLIVAFICHNSIRFISCPSYHLIRKRFPTYRQIPSNRANHDRCYHNNTYFYANPLISFRPIPLPLIMVIWFRCNYINLLFVYLL